MQISSSATLFTSVSAATGQILASVAPPSSLWEKGQDEGGASPLIRSQLLGSKLYCECGQTHLVPIRTAMIEPGAVEKTAEVLQQLGRHCKTRVFLLADATTYEVAGRQVEKNLRGDGYYITRHILSEQPHANIRTVENILNHCSDITDIVVSCGSGTVTDLAKYIANAKSLPLIAVATAPSMNGYTSSIVALTESGLKTTRPVRPVTAVIADTDILAVAPIEMIRAGLGDLLSKPVAIADWKLASLLLGERFCPLPFALIKDLEEIYVTDSQKLAERDPATIAALTEAIIYSGISMVLAGNSSPASGGEHLISHFLDMLALQGGYSSDLHGVQVGVGTIASASLYDRIFQLEKSDLRLDIFNSSFERAKRALSACRQIFGEAVFSSIEREFSRKWGNETDVLQRNAAIVERWDEIRLGVGRFIPSLSYFSDVLTAAGSKTHFSQLTGVSAETFRNALMYAFCIRSRFTVLDLAFTLGALDLWADELTESS